MPIDDTRALEAQNGFQVNYRESGNLVNGPLYTGGPSSPVGMNLPVSTVYVQNEGTRIIVWQKFGAGVNDWRVYPAQDIGLDVSGLISNSSDLTGLTNVQDVVAAIANRHFGKQYGQASNGLFQTSSATFFSALSFSGTRDAGNYRFYFQYSTTNSKSNTNNESRFTVNGTQYFLREQIGLAINSVGRFVTNISHPGGTLTANLELRRSLGNGLAEVSATNIELWRIS